MLVSVVGARGFIGSRVAEVAEQAGHQVLRFRHDEVPRERPLGTVVYCSGVAWGAEARPFEAFDQHAVSVQSILRGTRYERFVFVSSTKVYGAQASTSETTPVSVRPDVPADTYAATKIAGEALTLAASQENRVVRLSNVFGASLGSGLFLSDILRQAASTGRMVIRSARASSKDYVSVDDVAHAVLAIAARSKERIYNIAAGKNTSHGDLIDAIRAVLPIEVDAPLEAPTVITPGIDTRRIQGEHPFLPHPVLDAIPRLLEAFKRTKP